MVPSDEYKQHPPVSVLGRTPHRQHDTSKTCRWASFGFSQRPRVSCVLRLFAAYQAEPHTHRSRRYCVYLCFICESSGSSVRKQLRQNQETPSQPSSQSSPSSPKPWRLRPVNDFETAGCWSREVRFSLLGPRPCVLTQNRERKHCSVPSPASTSPSSSNHLPMIHTRHQQKHV